MISRRLLTTALLSTCLTMPLLADDAKTEAQSNPLIEKVSDFYKTLPGATFKSTTHVVADDMPQPMIQMVEVAIAKPNKFSLRSTDDMSGADIVSNGTSIMASASDFEIYSESPAPKTLAEVAEQANNGEGPFAMSDPMLPMLLTLFTADPQQLFSADFMDITSAPSKEFDGIHTDGITFRMTNNAIGDMNMTAYFAQGDQPWLIAVIPDLSELQQEGMPSFEVTLKMEDWKAGEPDNAAFALKPKENWTKVDDLVAAIMDKQQEMMEGMEFEGDGQEPTHKLVGEQAEDFELPMLRDDKMVKLSNLRGKIVVLDFWATWCGPCVMGLPHVVEAVDAFKDKGVVFFAIDQDEPAEKVQAFVDRKKWTFPVLMDKKGMVAKKFGVVGIPQTVIIGADGTILNIHVGFLGPKTTKSNLTEDIEAAIAANQQG